MNNLGREAFDGLQIEVGKPHPRHPVLIVEKTRNDWDIKIKGMRGWRHPRYPMLRSLTAKENKDLKESLKRLAEKRKAGIPT